MSYKIIKINNMLKKQKTDKKQKQKKRKIIINDNH